MARGKKKKIQWNYRNMIQGPLYCLVLNQEDFDLAVEEMPLENCKGRTWVNEGALGTAHIGYLNGTTAIVGLNAPESYTLEEIYGLLVHEAVHIWQEYKKHIGETDPGEEFEAYSIQNISLRLFMLYKEQVEGK